MRCLLQHVAQTVTLARTTAAPASRSHLGRTAILTYSSTAYTALQKGQGHLAQAAGWSAATFMANGPKLRKAVQAAAKLQMLFVRDLQARTFVFCSVRLTRNFATLAIVYKHAERCFRVRTDCREDLTTWDTCKKCSLDMSRNMQFIRGVMSMSTQ